jgi:ADP-dependent NAD(P)H-hydrate dehydratase / NAD(P)H-hydrate epimerase
MKILNATQIRECDAYTIEAGNMGSAELMERAASRCVAWLRENLPKDSLFVVLCGSGNNGGDGLAITRMLHQRGFGVKAFLLQLTPELSPDCRFNLTRLQQIDPGLVSIAAPGTFITDIQKHIVIIDAILGTGLNRPVTGWLSSFIGSLNILQNRKIAIDIPSGLSADQLPGPDDVIVKATDTLSFQFYKRSFLHAEAAGFTGNIHLLDIGLNAAFIDETATQYYITDQRAATALYRPRPEFSHKGTFGNVLIVGGQYGKMGAITLSSKAALRAGAGLVTALVPACGYQILQTAVPESMCATSGDTHIESITGWELADAIGIGPGMGTEPATVSALSVFLETYKKPLVLDADALNIIAAHPELLAKLPKGSILTPHPKEFARLFGTNTNSLVQVDNARIQAMRYNINIVLKGRHTAVINSDGDCSYNSTGNSGIATGGSGDVLTGVITGLLAQGYEPYDAAVLGVFLHGLAGDIAAAELSKEAMIAGDLIKYLGQAFLSLQQQ